jgi:hypothetical protein
MALILVGLLLVAAAVAGVWAAVPAPGSPRKIHGALIESFGVTVVGLFATGAALMVAGVAYR